MRPERAVTVSVLLAVRGEAPWLSEAISSVLAQRGSSNSAMLQDQDVELVIVDDGATGNACDVLRDFELRVRQTRRRGVVVRGNPGRGLAAALNLGLRWCSAERIARLDADDAMCAGRLARQVAFLDAHPHVGMLGTAWREIDAETSATEVIVRPPTGDDALRRLLPRRNPFAHSSIMLRRSALDRAGGGYDETYDRVAQDYALWVRMSRVCELACLDEILTVRRRHAGQVSVQRARERRQAEARVRWAAIRRGWWPWWSAGPWAIRASLAARLLS